MLGLVLLKGGGEERGFEMLRVAEGVDCGVGAIGEGL
jgi:hypothetical protein